MSFRRETGNARPGRVHVRGRGLPAFARLVCLAAAFPLLAAAPDTSLLQDLRGISLDPEACFRVRDLSFSREDIKLYLTDGYLIFAKPVGGRRLAAVFSADTDGGDAEVLLLPPHRAERLSLASFTKSPNLNEHLFTALFLFTDQTAAEWSERIESGGMKKSGEMGAILAPRWNSVVRNVIPGFEVRFAMDLLRPADTSNGFFFMTANGRSLGLFDITYDPRGREQVIAGQLTERNNKPAYDIWCAFASRSIRNQTRKLPPDPFTVQKFVIDAELRPDLSLAAVTRATITVGPSPLRAVNFLISRRIKLNGAKIDGVPAEIFPRESLREAALRATDDESFLVVGDGDLAAGSTHEVEVRHEGNVIISAGNNVYYVSSRASWYPRRGMEFAAYDITFRHPKSLSLVLPGATTEDRVEGDLRIVRHKSDMPLRLAGFNLGEYNRATAARGNLTVDVFSNRQLEAALMPRNRDPATLPPLTIPRPLGRPVQVAPPPPPPPDPKARLKTLAADIAAAFDFMSQLFGPPPVTTLNVAPIPGVFGQGFPGLLYLSTIAYLDPVDRPAALRSKESQVFFSDLMEAHETAHQWFGNMVTSAGYQHDWLMEALANYSALLYLEKKKGAKAVESELEEFRSRLTKPTEDGRSRESAGPITFGLRLDSVIPDAWRTITYDKGTWIIHMLRRRMGDEAFLKMLAELCRRYRFLPVSTEEFRALAAQFLPAPGPKERLVDPKLENFFENWVYATGTPSLQLKYNMRGKPGAFQAAITITQSGVDEDFTPDIPVEISYGPAVKGVRPHVVWLRAGAEPTTHLVPVRQAPTRVAVASNAILTRK